MKDYNRVKQYKDRVCYYLNKKLHRLDGPAVEYNDGCKIWYKNGRRHRIDGPVYEDEKDSEKDNGYVS